MSLPAPFILPFAGVEPEFGGPPEGFGPESAVLGRVTAGRGLSLGRLAVIRADGHFVRIGDDFRLGVRSTVHIAHELYPAIVGDRVVVGRNACVHACTVGNDCVIEDDVVILDAAVVEDRVVLEAGSTVFPRAKLPGGFVYAGSPAKPVREVAPGELAERSARLRAVPDQTEDGGEKGGAGMQLPPTVFVARTARLRGSIRMASESSVFFSCDLDAGSGEIVVGENSNIQDNTVVRCSSGSVTIGRDSVLGHNVHLEDCSVGDRALVGIGAVVAAGTVVEDEVLLAAGAWTNPGQILERGWLWAGRPARALSRLDDAKRELISWTVSGYREYARDYARFQRERQPAAAE